MTLSASLSDSTIYYVRYPIGSNEVYREQVVYNKESIRGNGRAGIITEKVSVEELAHIKKLSQNEVIALVQSKFAALLLF